MGKKQTLNSDWEVVDTPSKTITIGDWEVTNPEPVNPYIANIKKEEGLDKLTNIVNDIPDLDDTKKKIWKDLALKGTPQEDLSNALLTLQGKHSHQDGGDKYYYNDKGVPVPLKSDERPPQGFDVANDLHGTQQEANEKGFLASAGGHLYNGVVKGVLGLEGLANLPYALATGDDADWYKAAKNRVESSLYKSPEYETENQLFDTKDMKGVEDFLDPKRYNFDLNTVQGAALQGLESVTSFLVGTKGLGAASKLSGALSEGAGLIGEGGKLAKFASGVTSSAQKTQAFGGAYAITLPEVLDYVEASGIEGREKYALSSAIAVPMALTEMMFGTEGQFVKNSVAKTAKENIIKGIVDGVKENADGTLSKEFLAEAFKATTKEATKLNKSLAREIGEGIAEEGVTEGFQELQKQGLAEIYDHISSENNFKNDPLSLQSFGEYYNSILSGAAGAMGPSTAATIQKRNIEVQKKQSKNIFNTVQKGEEAVNALKLNIDKAVRDGEISPEQGANAIIKVDAYDTYNKQTSGLSLKDEDKRRVFDLTFEKANLESQIPTDYEAEKLNGIQQAQINVKKKQAKHLQDEIDKLILRDDVQNTTTPTAKKTEEEVEKDIEAEKELEAIRKTKIKSQEIKDKTKYEQIVDRVAKETRSYEEIPNKDWNNPKFDVAVKQHKFADELDKTDTKVVYGKVKIDNDTFKKDNNTFNVTLPDGKSLRFASSMKLDVEKTPEGNITGGHRGNTYQENFTNPDNPIGETIGLKVIKLKDSGRKVVFIWNADKSSPKYGKHIGMVKESSKGDSGYNKADLEEMANLRTTNMAEPGSGITEVGEPTKPIVPADVKLTKPKVVLGQPSRESLRTAYINDQKEKLGSDYDKDNDKFYDKYFGNKFDRLNPTLYEEPKGTAVTGEEDASGQTEETERKDTGSGDKAKAKKTGKTRINQAIKNPARLKALKLEVFSPRGVIMQYFIGGGKIDRKSVESLYKGSESEANKRSHMVLSQEKWGEKYAPSIDQLAHDLWETNKDKTPNSDTSDYRNELEDVIGDYVSVVKMAEDLVATMSEEQFSPQEEEMNSLYEKAEQNDVVEEVEEIQDEVEQLENEELDKWEDDSDIDSEEKDIPFQKVSSVKGDITKVVAKLKSAMPKMKVVFDENLKVAGKVKGDTITINPYHAGIDTPIHEYGHVLIDAIGYNNKVIQSAIKQLKTSKLWAETKERYPELDEENLGKEVLAEAIGREGVGIFDKEADKSKFKVFLDYIFDWLKTKLGMNKNIAKSLAKQIIGGVGTKEMVGKTETEQLQKTKETPEEKKARKAEKKALRSEQEYSIKEITEGKEIKDLSFDKLIELYNNIIGFEKSIQDKYFGDVKIQIAYRLFTEKKNQLEKWQKEGKIKGYNEEESNKSDIKNKDVLMKNLSHMTQIVPELQAFSKMFEGAYFDMTQERYELKNELQKFGKAVIKEKNKALGIVGRAKELFSSSNAKYFDFVENPKANLGVDEEGNTIYGPGYYTLEEGKKKGFTPAQMDFLKFMHKLQDERNAQLEAMGRDLTNEVLKVDKGVAEAWKTEGLMQAFSSFLGNGFNLRNVRVNYNGKPTPYGEIEKDLIAKGNKGTLDKLVALKDMFKYNMAAKRQIQKGVHVDESGENELQLKGGAKYGIDPHGALINKFMKPRNKERGYSKDFYKAAFDFIDESTHSKHMQELLPYIDSIEYLNKMGLMDDEGNVLHGVKDNVAEWVKQWKDLHLFKVDKVGKLGPEADAAMKLLRTLTSQIVMAFNLKAGLINIAMGQYNNLRKETAKDLKEGHARMIANPKKAADILKKYQVISIDYESNPKLFAGKLFDYLAHGLTRAGEYYIQGSMFLGLMTDEEYNSFEYKKNKDGVDELVYTGKDEKAFKDEMIKHKNRVSDIQGKYADKDRRNFMAGEFGKMVGQFKVWVPDWWKERFGEEYITADGEVKKGSYRNFTIDAAKDLIEQIKGEGPSAIWNNKEAMTNLKGALSVAVLLSLKFAGDDDDKKRKQGDLLSQMTSNVLFVFDPTGLKFTVAHPVAALGTLEKFAKVLEDGLKMDADKSAKDIGKLIPYNKIITQIPDLVSGE